MKRIWLLISTFVLLAGCEATPVDVDIDVSKEQTQEVERSANEYQNTRFGYTLLIPEGMVAYALTQEQTAVPAAEDSEVVFFVDGETNFFTVRGIDDGRTSHEWLTQNLPFFYPTGDAAQRVGEVSGASAIFLQGSGTPESPARLAVIAWNNVLIVVTYEQETPVFNALLESLSAI